MCSAFSNIINSAKECHRNGLLDRAVQHYLKAICVEPSSALALQLLAVSFLSGGKNKEATIAAARAARMDKNALGVLEILNAACFAWTNDAIRLQADNKPSSALEIYSCVLKISLWDEVTNAARINADIIVGNMIEEIRGELRSGKDHGAKRLLNLIRKLLPKEASPKLLECIISIYTTDLSDAAKYVASYANNHGISNIASDLAYIADRFRAEGKFSDAAKYCKISIVAEPASAAFYALLSQNASSSIGGRAALRLAQRALAIESENYAIRCLVGKAALDALSLQVAEECFLSSLRLQKNYKDSYEQLSQLRATKRHADAALNYFSRARKCDSTCNIYIKCYSRPIYLSRCISSIKRNVKNYGNIIILNDGIGTPFMERIVSEHPDVHVLNSMKVDAGIIASPQNEYHIERKSGFKELDYFDPARFWAEAVSMDDNEFVFMLEEDSWIIDQCDLLELTTWMTSNRCISFSIWNGSQEKSVLPSQEAARAIVDEVDLRSLYDNGRIGEIDLTNNWDEGYKVFPVAGSVMKKEYFVSSYQGVLHWADETNVMRNVIKFWAMMGEEAGTVSACMRQGIVWHTRNSTSRADAGGTGISVPIDMHAYNDAMSWAWHDGRIDPMFNYPDEIPPAYIEDNIKDYTGADSLSAWRAWRKDYGRKFPNLGVTED